VNVSSAVCADDNVTPCFEASSDAYARSFQVDRDHANSYEKWKALGSPEQPTAAQYAELEKASALVNLALPAQANVRDGKMDVPFRLSRQGVTLIRVTW
jgi:xylan 1,4-beta-xylosidase